MLTVSFEDVASRYCDALNHRQWLYDAYAVYNDRVNRLKDEIVGLGYTTLDAVQWDYENTGNFEAVV